MSIVVKKLVKIYEPQKAVNDISFAINKGEIVGFLGPNGAGKSTTMKIITGYLQPTAGEAFVCGINVAENPLAVKKKIGYLPELNALYYDMYVREYLLFIASLHAIENKKIAVQEVIKLTGLPAESRKQIGQLSKGYKQRVGLAAALIHQPEVLILDEPTSGLDPNQIVEIREVIKQQGKDKTVLFSTHILQEVEAICDRAIIINKGQIVADDKLEQLQKTGNRADIISVTFDKPLDKVILEKLAALASVTELQPGAYQLQTANSEQLKKHIMEIALQQNLNIVSLQSENQKLEQVFKSLTSS